MANFNIPYTTEREGQMEFFDNYGVPYNDDASILVDNTDGVFNGNIFEFKLNISNLNKTLFQAVKYLSKMRIKGESIPATILLIDLNATTVYVFRSQDYFDSIHKVYTGAASKDNDSFMAGPFIGKYDYSDILQSSQVKRILKGRKTDPDEMYMPVDIDENCVVGWAERYYSEKPKATKGDFLGDETGTAVKVGETNERFKYLMDSLNDRLSKKDLGAFYTPLPYAKKAAELVQMAVDRVPEGNDYIILDRCAGTGNLESALIGLYDRNGDELIEHCVVSTYEYYEYKVLQERIGDKVRDIIPPTEANVLYDNGKVANADAMSKDFIENPIIRQYVDDPHCAIIMFENPPYQNSSAITFTDENNSRATASRKDSYVLKEFRTIIPTLNEQRGAATEFSNLFIYSGFAFYLRHPIDSYIILSPVKYFKSTWLVKKPLEKGFLFNRKHFHATDSTIACCLWTNTQNVNVDAWDFEVWDISEKGELQYIKTQRVGKVKAGLSVFNDMRSFADDVETTVACEQNGTPITYSPTTGRRPIYNKNIIAYLVDITFTPDVKNYNLVRCNVKRGLQKSFGFHLRVDNYLTKLPLWVCKLFPQDAWYEKDVFFNTSDGGDAYTKDPNFLKSCLIYTCLSNQNKCLTFDGSDGRHYQNELCFDGLNKAGDVIPKDTATLALKDLRKYALNPKTALDDDEKELLELWFRILREAQQTANYNPDFTYGVYQVSKELDTYKEEGSGRKKTRVYDYPALHGDLDTLRVKLKEYYKSHITDKMFEYELLK